MSQATLEARIVGGQLVATVPGQWPRNGPALVTLIPEPARRPDWDKVEDCLGTLQLNGIDSAQWQAEVRDQWDRS